MSLKHIIIIIIITTTIIIMIKLASSVIKAECQRKTIIIIIRRKACLQTCSFFLFVPVKRLSLSVQLICLIKWLKTKTFSFHKKNQSVTQQISCNGKVRNCSDKPKGNIAKLSMAPRLTK